MRNDEPSKETRGTGGGLTTGVSEFLGGVLDNALMRYDILRFFYENPNAILTVSDLSTWMSRKEMPLAKALQQLSGLGYLGQSQASSAFVLSSDRGKRHKVEEFFSYLDDNPEATKAIRTRLHRRTEAE